MFRRSLLVVLAFLLLSAVAGVQAQDAVGITVRCKASRRKRTGAATVSPKLRKGEGGPWNRHRPDLIQDNAGWGDYKQEFVLASEAGEAAGYHP